MRKWLILALLALVALLLTAAVAGPLGPMPGMYLGGQATDPPSQWSSVAVPEQIQLETRGGLLPRVVNLWIVESDNELYVFGATDSGWVNATRSDPQVRLRMEDQTYSLMAAPLAQPDLTVYERYLARYADDYPDIVAGMPAIDELDGAAGVIFHLQRPPSE
ncbi:MAG: hypothetical protein AAF993_11140 [Pseudomonadota bacterium]